MSAALSARMSTPKILPVLASATILINPLVSLMVIAFGTIDISTVLHAHSYPPSSASFSVRPTDATWGEVNTALGTGRKLIFLCVPCKAFSAAVAPSFAAMVSNIGSPITSPAAQTLLAVVCISRFTFTAPSSLSFTPTTSSPRSLVLGALPVAIRSSSPYPSEHGQTSLSTVLALRHSARAHDTLPSRKTRRPTDQGGVGYCGEEEGSRWIVACGRLLLECETDTID